MSSLALCDSFEYLCYGSKAIGNMLALTARGSTLDVRRQILSSEVDSRAVRVKTARYISAWVETSDSANNVCLPLTTLAHIKAALGQRLVLAGCISLHPFCGLVVIPRDRFCLRLHASVVVSLDHSSHNIRPCHGCD